MGANDTMEDAGVHFESVPEHLRQYLRDHMDSAEAEKKMNELYADDQGKQPLQCYVGRSMMYK